MFANHLLSFNCKCCIESQVSYQHLQMESWHSSYPAAWAETQKFATAPKLLGSMGNSSLSTGISGHNHVLPAWFTCFFLARPRLNKQPFGFVARQAPHQENIYFPCSFSSCAFLVTSLARTLRDRDQKNICIKKKRDQPKIFRVR